MNITFLKDDKEAQAIKRIRYYSDISYATTGKSYFAAYSGGKDSDVIRILCELAGVPHELHHSLTTVDAPETIQYIKQIPNVIIDKPCMSMWQLIVKKRMPPTRIARYCCEALKEGAGADRLVVTGVRWAESVNRKNRRNSLEVLGTPKNTLILNADNDTHRRQFETCTAKGKRILNPIIDWSDDDVWDFLQYYNCKSNPLYKQGYKRVGCVGCPMAGGKGQQKEFAKWPKYKQLYINAFDRMIQKSVADGRKTNWQTGQEVFDWWIGNNSKKYATEPGQIALQI